MNTRRRSLLWAFVFLATPLLASLGQAAEVSVRNDSEVDGSTATPCQCFLAGESVAAWLTAPVSGKIVAVQVLWKSPFGGNPSSMESSIKVFNAGTFPTPGAILPNDGGGQAQVTTPTLQDGIINEFRHLDPAQTIPLSVSVAQGQTFVVSLEFFNNTGGIFSSDVAWDADGCQPQRNAIFTIPGGWSDACPAGVTGDWVIRAVIDEAVDVPAVPGWALAFMVLLLAAAGIMSLPHRQLD